MNHHHLHSERANPYFMKCSTQGGHSTGAQYGLPYLAGAQYGLPDLIWQVLKMASKMSSLKAIIYTDVLCTVEERASRSTYCHSLPLIDI